MGNTEGGCFNGGCSSSELRPPMNLQRTLTGRIAYDYLQVNNPSARRPTRRMWFW